MKKVFTVALFRAPDCIRGWLAYSNKTVNRYTSEEPDVVMSIVADNMPQAKQKAITAIRKADKEPAE